ncbi:hypothetical protein DMUE_5050 [Dictyocoela muelleri]|nr:hypothetical protein DMUE_5050 [Dictyocoela muelleri]
MDLRLNSSETFTAPHNPTGNAIIERINREISVSLRFSRKISFSQAMDDIYTRINLTSNSTIRSSPYIIFFKKPLLETHDAKFIINDDLITKKLNDNNRDVIAEN